MKKEMREKVSTERLPYEKPAARFVALKPEEKLMGCSKLAIPGPNYCLLQGSVS